LRRAVALVPRCAARGTTRLPPSIRLQVLWLAMISWTND
jgi:hypothetical protein